MHIVLIIFSRRGSSYTQEAEGNFLRLRLRLDSVQEEGSSQEEGYYAKVCQEELVTSS